MLRINLRIGTKLAMSAGLGVILVVAMVGNQAYVNQITNDIAREIKASETVQKAVLLADVGQRRLLVQTRDIRNAATPKDIAGIQQKLKEYGDIGLKGLDTALAAVTIPAVRTQLEAAKASLTENISVSGDLAAGHKNLLDVREQQTAEGRGWPKIFDPFVTSPAVIGGPQSVNILALLYRADSQYKQARINAWSRLVRDDDGQVTRIYAALDDAVDQLRKARVLLADDPVAVHTVDELSAFPVRFHGVIDGVSAATESQAKMMRERADPVRARTDNILQAIKAAMDKHSAELEEQASAATARAEWINVAAGCFVALVLVGSAVFSTLTIGRPIRRIAAVLLRLAGGDKTVTIPYGSRGDEVGEAARAAQTFKDNLLRMEALEAEQKETELRRARERKADMQKLADSFEAAVGSIVQTVSTSAHELQRAAGTLTQTAETTQQLSGIVASASEEASANVQSVASATEELTSSVNEISRRVHESSTIAHQAVSQAQKTDARIADLSQAASRIGDVVKLITAIAEQTNLLALNATIEAARAGEAGKGFAVVASEVKQLASQTAKATDEIGAQISSMQTATQESVLAIKEIGGTIGRIAEIASAIAAAVEEQGATTQEIARNVQEAAQGTAQVAANIGDVNRGASATGSASSQVLASAGQLSGEGGRLRTEVDRFLATVRAA